MTIRIDKIGDAKVEKRKVKIGDEYLVTGNGVSTHRERHPKTYYLIDTSDGSTIAIYTDECTVIGK